MSVRTRSHASKRHRIKRIRQDTQKSLSARKRAIQTGFHLLLIQQLGCTAWFQSTHWKRHTSCHPSTVNCVVTFRYREVSGHSPHSLLSQSKIVESTRCTRPCSPTESPSTCSSAVQLYRSCCWCRCSTMCKVLLSLPLHFPGLSLSISPDSH